MDRDAGNCPPGRGEGQETSDVADLVRLCLYWSRAMGLDALALFCFVSGSASR